MNYEKIYESLILKAKNRDYMELEYFERHHILPKSLGGSNDESNIVKLSFREHYLAHWLLVKIAKTEDEKYKMCCAFFIMSKGNNGLRNTNSKLYERARNAFITHRAEYFNSKEGKSVLKRAARKRVETMQSEFVFHLFHADYGDFLLPTNVIMDMFPDQNLNSSNLVKVGKGERASHKGWILYDNKDLGVEGLFEIKRKKMSESALRKFERDPKYRKMASDGAKKSNKITGYKRHYHENGTAVRALPGSEKSKKLIEQGYYLK